MAKLYRENTTIGQNIKCSTQSCIVNFSIIAEISSIFSINQLKHISITFIQHRRLLTVKF